jgi:hypothetical protein
MAFCPRCHLPAGHYPSSQSPKVFCTDTEHCGWCGSENCHSMSSWISELPK